MDIRNPDIMEQDGLTPAGSYLDDLNENQREAVVYTDGPSLVIAGAGSGKTRVLTYKIVHLLHSGYEPWRILALTFTNKAAREMRERITSLVGAATAGRLWMGTFHSIFARILRAHADRIGYKSSFTIYDSADSRSLIKTIIKDMNLDDKVYKPAVVQNAISSAKNALLSPEAYAAAADVMEADRRARRPLIHAIYAAYRARCHASGAMDFDDLLYFMNVLLRDNPDILRHYREYFRYLLVDEYQDTNFAQHMIVSQLCDEGGPQLCVVGDDAQSIYSFRGANIRNILNLRKSYPTLQIFKLERNYRSTQNIINAANSLIAKNVEQIHKNVYSENAPGERIEVAQSYSDYEESFVVSNRISQIKMATGDSYEEFAILYRTNAQSRILEESLRKRNVPYRIYGGLSFYQRKEVKDAIAYFRLAVNPDDDEALRRVINYPARGIGETTVSRVFRAAMDNGVSAMSVIADPESYPTGVNAAGERRLRDFRNMIMGFVTSPTDDAETVALRIYNATRLLASLQGDRTPESISKQENLSELLSGVREFVNDKREEGSDAVTMADFLAEVALATDQDNKDDGPDERVTLMTVHAAKGLEFANVFIVGVEEDLFPSAMASGSAAEIEEERRLLYVALTRAKRFCMMSYATSRFRNGQTMMCSPSRFLRDIDPKYLRPVSGTALQGGINPVERYRESYHSPTPSPSRSSTTPRPEFVSAMAARSAVTRGAASVASGDIHTAGELNVGMRIEHPRFGKGTITSIDTTQADARIKVNFDNTEPRTLLLRFARFAIL